MNRTYTAEENDRDERRQTTLGKMARRLPDPGRRIVQLLIFGIGAWRTLMTVHPHVRNVPAADTVAPNVHVRYHASANTLGQEAARVSSNLPILAPHVVGDAMSEFRVR